MFPLAKPELTIDPSKRYIATITTSKGPMEIELFASDAPNTVNNFVYLAEQGFYKDAPFHRVIEGFMIQTGDGQRGDGTGGPGYRFDDEPVNRPYTRGTVAMANAGPNTNGSQFFVMHQDYGLPPQYTIFGKLISGEDTLDAIATTRVGRSPSGENSAPVERIVIQDVSIRTE